jgi:hypothetical protein
MRGIVPTVPTPADLRRRAAELERQAAALRRAADEAEKRMGAALLESGLESEDHDGTVISTTMNTETKPTGEKLRQLGIAKARGSKHPFPQALYRSGSTVTDWAEAHGLDRNIVKSWFAKGAACRPIPRKLAKEIERAYGIPATPDVWLRGLKD